jgi:hypothetical protein
MAHHPTNNNSVIILPLNFSFSACVLGEAVVFLFLRYFPFLGHPVLHVIE